MRATARLEHPHVALLTCQSVEKTTLLARFSSTRVLGGLLPSRFQPGNPLLQWGAPWKCSGTAYAFPTSAPFVAGGPRVELPARQFALRAGGPSAVESLSPLPRGLTGCPPDVPGVYRLKSHSLSASWRGRAPCGASPRGAYWLSARRPRPIPPPAFLYREPRSKRDPRGSSAHPEA